MRVYKPPTLVGGSWYQHTIKSNADQKIKISEEALEYDDNEINQSLKNMIKDIKLKMKNI